MFDRLVCNAQGQIDLTLVSVRLLLPLGILFMLVGLVSGQGPAFVVENKCPPAFTVVNKCPSPAVAPTPVQAVLHWHRCGRCGTMWAHADDSFGSVAAHTCPQCGTGPWFNKVAAPAECPPGRP
jgi:phage FluMu protein Com